jgi:hypothetical protein
MTTLGNRSPGRWRKSSYSDGNGGNCVEVGMVEPGQPPASVVRLLAVRDSKDPAGPRLRFTPTAWHSFACDIKNGVLHHLV